jgi:hypothetical protein
MKYCLHDANGYVGDLGSQNALMELRFFVFETADYPLVRQFFEEGVAAVTEELIEGFRVLSSEDIAVQASLDNLIEMLGKCDAVAVINEVDD